jgi:hypothetical protein
MVRTTLRLVLFAVVFAYHDGPALQADHLVPPPEQDQFLLLAAKYRQQLDENIQSLPAPSGTLPITREAIALHTTILPSLVMPLPSDNPLALLMSFQL